MNKLKFSGENLNLTEKIKKKNHQAEHKNINLGIQDKAYFSKSRKKFSAKTQLEIEDSDSTSKTHLILEEKAAPISTKHSHHKVRNYSSSKNYLKPTQ